MCSTSAGGSNAKRISTWYAFALGAAFDVRSWFEIIQNFLRNDEILVLPISKNNSKTTLGMHLLNRVKQAVFICLCKIAVNYTESECL